MKNLLLPLLFATATTAHAENILGDTTPFSKSQACQQVKCQLLSETKVGPYVVYTYTGKTGDTDNTDAKGGNYFSIKRNEKNVALGIYYFNAGGGAGDYDEKFAQLEAPNVAKLLGLKAPDAKASKAAIFSIPAGQDILLSNKSARPDANSAVSVVYAVQKSEAGAVAALLNRADPEGKKRVIEEFKRGLGASGDCTADRGYRGRDGKPLKVNSQNYSYLTKWLDSAEKRGAVRANAMDTGVLLAPGLSSTTIEPTFNLNDRNNPKAAYNDAVCLK